MIDMGAHLTSRTRDPGAPPATTPPVTLLHARTAYDYEFIAARLHDQYLLHTSVAVSVFRTPLLAVPVGGRRRGGGMEAGPVGLALAIRDALLERDGFPGLRIRAIRSWDEPLHWVVEWGEHPPTHATDQERARFYGVRDRTRPSWPPPGAS
ncbi:hypothetical protein B1H18_32180 [Streptomyces tsukubensis]|uniref:Uncharacterized protein n=1 Tax=Streptomyces tsukubensis TaxID=83656 RepID=A0A1V3ZZD8_9ACTN|nr:hypothetical protein B1H18_32180 [Streptomyces tsukubensis]